MSKLSLCLILFVLLGFQQKAYSEIYKWTDENGQVHYTNKKPKNKALERVQLKQSPNIYTSQNISQVNSKSKVTKFQPRITSKIVKTKAKSQDLIMYSASWCGYCDKARAHFYENNIRFKEYDIETSDKGRRDHENLEGRGVPFLVYGSKKMHGFSAAKFNQFYKK